jgi:hypothetical protein
MLLMRPVFGVATSLLAQVDGPVVRCPWLTESEPQQMCLNIRFAGLNGFLILRGRIGAG